MDLLTTNEIESMADIANKYAENGSGKFYVDDQCIDCDLCPETAPVNFMRSDDGGYSYVLSPRIIEARAQALSLGQLGREGLSRRISGRLRSSWTLSRLRLRQFYCKTATPVSNIYQSAFLPMPRWPYKEGALQGSHARSERANQKHPHEPAFPNASGV